MRKYYTVHEVEEITGFKRAKSYLIIRSLNEQLKKELPGQMIFQGRILRWFFDEKILGIKREEAR